MSSMVSRRPETPNDFGSDGWPMNHRNEAFWMSMRLGTSRTFSSFENVLRLRGAVVLAGKASPPAGLVGELRSVVPDQGATPKVSSEGPCPQRTGERAACGPNFPSRSGAISGHYTAIDPQVKPTACRTSRGLGGGSTALGGRSRRRPGDVQRMMARGQVPRPVRHERRLLRRADLGRIPAAGMEAAA